MRSYFHDVERANIASNNLRTPYIGMARLCCHGWLRVRHQGDQAHTSKLEGRIDDERQFKTAKRSQAPGDATVRKRFFRVNFVILSRRSKKDSIFGMSDFSTNFQFS